MQFTSHQIKLAMNLASQIEQKISPLNVLVLNHSEANIFDSYITKGIKTIKSFPLLCNDKNWDLILGDFPFGLKDPNNLINRTNRGSYAVLKSSEATDLLSNIKGIGCFTIESNSLNALRKILNQTSYSITAIFKLKDESNEQLIHPIIVLTSKQGKDFEFIAELTSIEQIYQVTDAYFANVSGSNLNAGLFLEKGVFQGFNNWKVLQLIKQQETEYKSFKSILINDFTTELNFVNLNSMFEDKENSLYFPRQGNSSIENKLEDIPSTKHRLYYQVVCDTNIVNTDYLIAFFESTLGKLIHQSMKSESLISIRSRDAFLHTKISIPDLETQKQIAISLNKLKIIKKNISTYESNLAINPISSSHTLNQIDNMLEVVGQLADEDKIKTLIREGESKTIEFKQSLSLDMTTKEKKIELEDSVIKTIGAFLNSDGGTLLVGVSDNGTITGIDEELSKFHKNSTDKFLLYFKNKFKSRVGEQCYQYVNNKILKINSHKILIVECKKSKHPVFIDESIFFVRTNPATDKLEGSKLVQYISTHFESPITFHKK